MTRRFDTAARYSLLVISLLALVGLYAVAANQDLDQTGRFTALVVIGGIALVGWPAIGLMEPYPKRRPLWLRWGKPGVTVEPVSPPPAERPDEVPAVAPLDIRNSVIVLTGAALAAGALGIAGYALADTASTDGGLAVYPGFVAALLAGARCAFRLTNRRRAVTVLWDEITLGAALGYVPNLRLPRDDVTAIETSGGAAPLVAIVDGRGRRYEVNTAHLSDRRLANHLAALWPDVPWNHLPGPDR